MADDTNSEKKNKAPQVADMTRPGFATDGSKLVWRKPVLTMLPIEDEYVDGKIASPPGENSTSSGPVS